MSSPTHHYHFAITMTCSGCSGAIDRVLKKTEGPFPYIPPFSPLITPLPLPLNPHHHPQRTANNPGGIGLTSYEVNLEQQTADVYTDSVAYETVLEKIKKTGKEVRGGERDGEVVGV